jgi:hypothetical protein
LGKSKRPNEVTSCQLRELQSSAALPTSFATFTMLGRAPGQLETCICTCRINGNKS